MRLLAACLVSSILSASLVASLAAPAAAAPLPPELASARSGRPDRPIAAPDRLHRTPDAIRLPADLRQGGDTIADAVPFEPLLAVRTGTTVGYANDYDEVCPYSGSTAPDVVYRLEHPFGIWLDIDLLGSSYDTKVYLYDADLNLVACNDDYWGVDHGYVSRLPTVELTAGVPHYLVIDGYGAEAGEYVVTIHQVHVEILDCPAGSVLEGEPPLAHGYVDEYNAGCAAPGPDALQPLVGPIFCGRSGWYQFDGSDLRDTDWFTLNLPPSGTLTITGDATYTSYLFELGPLDCSEVGVLQNVSIGPISDGDLTLTGEPGAEAWVWVGPATFQPPPGHGDLVEYTYVLWLDGPVAVQATSLSAIKALFNGPR